MSKKNLTDKTVIILSVSSDIGLELAKKYLQENYQVIGTYRHYGRCNEIEKNPRCILIKCDIMYKKSIQKFIDRYKELHLSWNIFISAAGDPRPLTPFFTDNFDSWVNSVRLNALEQLRILHALYPLRDKKITPTAVFFSAGGVQKAVLNFSAYTLGKIILIKMAEYLAAENPELNIFTVSPGWVKTKIHKLILKDSHVSREKFKNTKSFLRNQEGTKFEDIYQYISLLEKESRAASGRNFHVPSDPWKGKKAEQKLIKALHNDPDMYKLRRFRNDSR